MKEISRNEGKDLVSDGVGRASDVHVAVVFSIPSTNTWSMPSLAPTRNKTVGQLALFVEVVDDPGSE